MSDDPNQPNDPLAVLEDLLAKQKSSGVPADSAASVAAESPDLAAAAQEAEKVQKQAEYERLQAEAAARDAELLAQQQQKMQELSGTPEYQARVEQNAAVTEEKQHSSDEQQGFEITQLSTTRVPADQAEEL